MKILENLQKNFEEIIEVKSEYEDKKLFLRIEIDTVHLNEIVKVSKQINKWMDENDFSTEEYYLDIFSKGKKLTIDLKDINDHIGERVLIDLKEPLKNMYQFIGDLMEITKDLCVIKWNAKGQFRKQEIKLTNIKNIEKNIKF